VVCERLYTEGEGYVHEGHGVGENEEHGDRGAKEGNYEREEDKEGNLEEQEARNWGALV
jgi:hypothetical protein